MEIKTEDITQNGDIFEKIKGNILYRPNNFKIIDYGSVKMDEFEIGHVISEKAEGYEVTIDAGNGTHFVVVVTKFGEKLTMILEKFWKTERRADSIETNMKVMKMLEDGTKLVKIVDGRYKLSKNKFEGEELAEKIRTEGFSFVHVERVS
ncbi:hypothetical protein IC006_1248 [Sulfuracidifex tepidarius]|uniref:Uncharacterized protein n=1 Tax=Sulfuracidifex tepidarius TaxID=1294262 RepID=A0A510DV80_9CREN|nr:hypothetical protein [Sulfuracidifex tepidarius]BBG23950.1 hypothetical protein IC006_1248 [Sulfuracidifex tepidarius]